MVPVDEYFNEINLNPNKQTSTLKNNHSAASLLSDTTQNEKGSSNMFTLSPDEDDEVVNKMNNISQLNSDDAQRKQQTAKRNSKISLVEPSSSTVSLPVSHTYDLTDVFVIWRNKPLPPHTNDVN
jgi:hypothetical protein